ncbi:MAG: insulinase family protein [Frankiaceae bacterium]|nr:insulinase family protein [Frankiaceae bacterium]
MSARARALPATGSGGAPETVRRSVLPGGLRVVSEQVPGSRSVAFGIWVGVGSRDERPSNHGASHFLEHLLFKGTERRSAFEITEGMDAVGGEMNAFTDKEFTCYYARVLDEDLPLAVDVVSDMVLSSVLTAEDVELERGVILEEIAMHDDDPSDAVHDQFASALFGGSPLGRPVIGTVESIEGLSRRSIAGFYERRYALPQMVVSAAGGVDHDRLLRLVRKAFGDRLTGDAVPAGLRPADRAVPSYAGVSHVERSTEQTNLVLGTTGLSREDPRRFALSVLSGALGGGMSSRLFQSVREDRGLAYSVYSYSSGHADTGQFGVYAGCAASKVGEVLSLVRAELDDVVAHGLRDDEVRRSKGSLRGQLVLGLEDTGSRMTRIGKAELVHGEVLTPQQVLDAIDAVTPDDVRAVAQDVLVRPLSLAVIGPVDGADLEGAIR